jgi:hypothetical protein
MTTEEGAVKAWETNHYWPSESWDVRVSTAIADGTIPSV